jgi:hypothetical protein
MSERSVRLFLLLMTIALLNSASLIKNIAALTPPAATPNTDSILLESRKAYYHDDYDGALKFLELYFVKLDSLPYSKSKDLFRFYAIASMGRIFLQNRQNPKGAIDWFQKIKKNHYLSEAESSIVDAWIAGANEWIKLGKFPRDIQNAGQLLDLGKKYYEAGLKKQKYPMDVTAAVDFSIAASYLIPFTVHDDRHIKIGEALFMMGDIRRRLWSDNLNWSQNYYLSEVIRRFPGTPIAVKAYQALNDDVHFGYSGTSGDNTPASWIALLSEFRKLAFAPSSVTIDTLR